MVALNGTNSAGTDQACGLPSSPAVHDRSFVARGER
ncbi:hypothetical protein E2C01_076619 [Portunus trituberculatus]|uniref:Uncharacterized protein n=1 Tax=Portunus trituberculatus TaxID=210409 RepID=A0A5B7IK68_PORTR|nr:hypothetical protein [Portunus trituberculatus]